jgi:hypothetical protein
MGNRNAKEVKILEPYTSFEVLPTEYFNRKALQEQFIGSQQPPIMQPAIPPPHFQVLQPNIQQSIPPPPPQPQQFPAHSQQQFFLPQQHIKYPQYGSQSYQPQIGYNQNHPQVMSTRQIGYIESGPSMNQGMPSRHMLTLQRRPFGPTPLHQVQSVPKFSQAGPIVKF